MDGVIGGIILYKVGGEGFRTMEWLKTPSLSLNHKSHFFNFLENRTILWKNRIILNKVEKMRMVVKTHNSIFSPYYLVISKVFSTFALAITKNQFI